MAKKNDDPALNPSTTSAAYEVMRPRWQKMDDLLGGTESMRASGQRHLPVHPAESALAYSERLHRATLFNMTQITLDALVGLPFGNPVGRTDDIPPRMGALLDDIDMMGNNIDVFARRWFRDGLAKGFSAVLVDFPRTSSVEGRTIDDDRREGVRPYWVDIPQENIIFASSEIISGREVLTHVRLREQESRRVGFAEVSETRIRVFDHVPAGVVVRLAASDPISPGGLRGATVDESGDSLFASSDKGRVLVTIYSEDVEKGEDDPERWFVSDLFFMDIDEIPIAVFYTNREALMLAKPPLTDLADKNIAHWQSESDQTAILTVSRFPILASSGKIDSDRVTVGPNNWLNTEDPTGRWYYVEHGGAAIGAGEKDLERLERQMAQAGAQFLKKRPGSETATARALDSAEATSSLQDMAVRFTDILNLAWYFTAKWLRFDDRDGGAFGRLFVKHDFSIMDLANGSIAELGNARRARDLSRNRYLFELVDKGVLSSEFDPDLNDEELRVEMAEFASGVAGLDIDPGGGDDPPDPVADPSDDPDAPDNPDDPGGGSADV